MQINRERLAQDLETLRQMGLSDKGVTRLAFSKEDIAAREWLIGQMEAAGLDVEIDPAGNIHAMLLSSASDSAPKVACGSHIDTVRCGGHLDGPLGVLAGLEALRCIKESQVSLAHPVSVIAFSDEEGRFGGMLGSRAMAGLVELAEIHSAKDIDGVALTQCLEDAGVNPENLLNAKVSADDYKAFLELHIEQGPVLEQRAIPIGVVDGITGLFKWEITLQGQANHAGTTPMHMRRDAFQGLARFAADINDILAREGAENSKATIGKVSLWPGSPNVVPGSCVFSLEVRDTDQKILEHLKSVFEKALKECAAACGLEITIAQLSDIQATPCDADIVDTLVRTAKAQNLPHIVMPSGAAHDAQYMAHITKTAMIFVPSIGGVSHNPAENTAMDDIEKGANLLLHSLYALAA